MSSDPFERIFRNLKTSNIPRLLCNMPLSLLKNPTSRKIKILFQTDSIVDEAPLDSKKLSISWNPFS